MNKHRGIVYYRLWQIALPVGFGISLAVLLTVLIEHQYAVALDVGLGVALYVAWADWKLRDLNEQLHRDEARIRKHRRKDHP